MSSRYIDREPVYHCGVCRDTGRVEIWHPATVRFFREVFLEAPPANWGQWERDERWKDYRPHYLSIVLTCNCERGRVERKTPLVKFDPDKHFPFDAATGAGLYQWLQGELCYDPVNGSPNYGLGGEF